MSIFGKELPQPIHIFKRNGDYENPFLDISEELLMTHNRIILKEVPNQFNRVLIRDDAGGYYLEKDMPDNLQTNEFYVDYKQGVVTFNKSIIGKLLTFTYKGEGFIMLSADRIFVHNNEGLVIETLQELIDTCKNEVEEYRQFIEAQIQTLNQKIILAQEAIDNANSSAENATQAATETRQATSNYQAIVDNTKKTFKQHVNTYSEIATAYPTPQIGWTVFVKDVRLAYRWDGSVWTCISAGDVVDGFNVFIGSVPPENTNLLWVDAPEHDMGTYGRVLASPSEPSNDSFIWWETD
ncbi:hypothetical protein [Priestia flexa]|uniref:hypothetical protein n=1 Tax=Priestia flexa TaxID=86664 RepID=UPI000473BA49|nr:hypothetical protein [Priestia flexa]